MNALHEMRENAHVQGGTPLQLWLKKHGLRSLDKYKQLLATPGGTGPIRFQAETPNKYFDAYIDPDNKFSAVDKLSQVSFQYQQHTKWRSFESGTVANTYMFYKCPHVGFYSAEPEWIYYSDIW